MLFLEPDLHRAGELEPGSYAVDIPLSPIITGSIDISKEFPTLFTNVNDKAEDKNYSCYILLFMK